MNQPGFAAGVWNRGMSNKIFEKKKTKRRTQMREQRGGGRECGKACGCVFQSCCLLPMFFILSAPSSLSPSPCCPLHQLHFSFIWSSVSVPLQFSFPPPVLNCLLWSVFSVCGERTISSSALSLQPSTVLLYHYLRVCFSVTFLMSISHIVSLSFFFF